MAVQHNAAHSAHSIHIRLTFIVVTRYIGCVYQNGGWIVPNDTSSKACSKFANTGFTNPHIPILPTKTILEDIEHKTSSIALCNP